MIRIFSCAAIFLVFNVAWASDGVKMRVKVTNLKNANGQLVIAVFNSADDYLEQPVDERFVTISETLDGTVEFSELPPGSYSIAAYHDKNSNGELDTFLGIPREDYGFSNDARSLFGPPKFKAAAIEINGDDVDVQFRVR